MAFAYSSECKALELPNPYLVQNRILWICFALMFSAGILTVLLVRRALVAGSVGQGILPVFIGLSLIAGGLAFGRAAASRARFVFGRDRPTSLAPEISLGATGGSHSAHSVKDILRSGSLSFRESRGAVGGLLYHCLPKLATSPSQLQQMAQRYVVSGIAALAILACFPISLLFAGNSLAQSWVGALYFALGLMVLSNSLFRERPMAVAWGKVLGMLAAATLVPAFVGRLRSQLPSLYGLQAVVQGIVILAGSLLGFGLAANAVRAHLSAPPATRKSMVEAQVSMNGSQIVCWSR